MRVPWGRTWLLSLILATGCYEGWDQNTGVKPPQTGTTPPATPALKLFSYILFQPVSMSSGAVNDTQCLPNASIAEFKAAEWNNRVAAIGEKLGSLTDVLVISPIQIEASDCKTLTAVTTAAGNDAPWGSQPSPLDSTSEKKRLHLKAALWDQEPVTTPASAVMQDSWTAWRGLEAGGLPALSVSYFVISHATAGFFSQWRDGLTKDLVLGGTVIDQIDPTEAGITARTSTIKTDTEALAAWLGTKA